MNNKNNKYLTSFGTLTILLTLAAGAALAQNAPGATARPQGQAAPTLGPTAFPTGGGAWLAPRGISVSVNRTTGAPSFALPIQPIDGSREQIARFDNWRKHPYAGTGPYPSTREENSALPTHTLYYPADLSKVPGKLPVLLFANGGCRNTSVEFTRFLGELASNGYFVAAIGRSDIPFMIVNIGAPLGESQMVGERKPGDARPLQNSSPEDMLKALDYAVAENGRKDSKFFGKIDPTKVAVMGQSCGGNQAFRAARDPRVTAGVALNSNFRSRKNTAGGGMTPTPGPDPYADWYVEDMKKPIAFFTGGPADYGAFTSTEISFREVSGAQSAVKVDAPLLGHTGAYPMPDVRWTNALLGWLSFILKNDQNGKAVFAGEHCGLCSDPDFWVKAKGIK